MIISKTPFRVSFFGGGTDYPEWFRREGGAVLSTTIDKYCYITGRILPPFFTCKHRIVWSHIETVDSISEILHPAVRAGLRYMGFDDSEGVEVHHQADLPARAGMGSSSAFVVGLLKVLAELKGEPLDKPTLARRAIELERDVLHEHVGCQDQVAAAFGGLNRIEFHTDGSFEVHPVKVNPERLRALEKRIVMIYTGTSRLATEVAASVIASFSQNEDTLRRMRRMVDEGQRILEGDGSLDDFGELLHEAWMCKRRLGNKVTNSVVDAVYEEARAAGALGGKLLGAGQCGFMIFYAPPEKQEAVNEALNRFLRVPFCVESRGCHLIHSELL